MSGYHIEETEIEIEDKANGTCIISYKGNNFVAFEKERRKIYIVSAGKEVLYVGEANTGIKTRLSRGCSAYNAFVKNNRIAKNGYKGYKWLDIGQNKDRKLNLVMIVFNKKYDSVEKRANIESIEGEIIYLIRKELGYWAMCQNEIHFSNSDEAKEIAKNIFDEVIK